MRLQRCTFGVINQFVLNKYCQIKNREKFFGTWVNPWAVSLPLGHFRQHMKKKDQQRIDFCHEKE